MAAGECRRGIRVPCNQKKRLSPCAIPAFLCAAIPAVGLAAEPAAPSRPAGGWTVTVGVEARYLPSFDGSDRYIVLPVPLFDVRGAGTPARFRSPRDGFGVGLLDSGNFRAGPVAKIRLNRDSRDEPGLRGLRDVPWGIELGAFAEYWAMRSLRLRAEVRHGVRGHTGLVGDLMADVVHPVTPQLTLSGGPRLSLASAAAQRPYFNVNPAESIATGLPVYNARGGVYSWGAGVQARYQWSPQWATHTFLEYERLTGSGANSPIVRRRGSPNQFTIGLGGTYSFDIGL
jgi:outer membrane protein